MNGRTITKNVYDGDVSIGFPAALRYRFFTKVVIRLIIRYRISGAVNVNRRQYTLSVQSL